MLSLVPNVHKELREIDDEIIKEESALRFVVDAADRVCETELIYIVNQLNIYGTSLHTYHSTIIMCR